MRSAVLKMENVEWGFFGTAQKNGYADPESLWTAVSELMIEIFEISPAHAQRLLDSRHGRHLADELSFVKGQLTAESAIRHLVERMVSTPSWRAYFRKIIVETR